MVGHTLINAQTQIFSHETKNEDALTTSSKPLQPDDAVYQLEAWQRHPHTADSVLPAKGMSNHLIIYHFLFNVHVGTEKK